MARKNRLAARGSGSQACTLRPVQTRNVWWPNIIKHCLVTKCNDVEVGGQTVKTCLIKHRFNSVQAKNYVSQITQRSSHTRASCLLVLYIFVLVLYVLDAWSRIDLSLLLWTIAIKILRLKDLKFQDSEVQKNKTKQKSHQRNPTKKDPEIWKSSS